MMTTKYLSDEWNTDDEVVEDDEEQDEMLFVYDNMEDPMYWEEDDPSLPDPPGY
jgi:hypothetical protein